jgi:acetolactate synthase-1/2/3 large subunit
MTSTGADLLVAELHRHGVRTVFGMPGSHTVAIYDAMVRHAGIRTILLRNEQAGAFAADGYARVTGQPGVVCTTAGPGATNALTGIAEAWGDSMPVLLLAGQVNHDRLHQECGNYHEIDLEGIFRPCTKYVATVMHTGQISTALNRAFGAMTTGRPRPAAVFCPQDLMAQPTPLVPPIADLPAMAPPPACHGELDQAAQMLATARYPILLAGGGALGAAAQIRALAERLHCPVITSLNAKGILDERDPFSLGHARSVRARAVQPYQDVMVAVGCRFTEVMTGFRKLPVPKKLIQIDIDPGQIGMNYPVAVGIVANAKDTLQAILERLPPKVESAWGDEWEKARQTTRPNCEWFIDTLRAGLPEDGVVFTDACEMGYRMHFDYPAYRPRSFFYPSNYIALGWAFPAAIGAAVALPDRAVVSVSGDGAFVMTCQELATAARYGLNLIAVVHNDSAYGAIKHYQQQRYGERYRDVDLNNPDFLQLAAAYGVPSARARNEAEFARALHQAIQRGGPGLIEVPDDWRDLRG